MVLRAVRAQVGTACVFQLQSVWDSRAVRYAVVCKQFFVINPALVGFAACTHPLVGLIVAYTVRY